MSLRLLAWLCPPNHPRVTTADRMALIHYRAVHALEFGWSWREHDAVIMFGRDAASRVPRHAEDSTRVADWTHSFLTADVFRYVNNVCCLHRFHAVNETLVLMEPAFLEEVVANLAARALAMGAAGLRLSYDGFNTRTMVRIPGQDGQRMSGAEAFSIGILGDNHNASSVIVGAAIGTERGDVIRVALSHIVPPLLHALAQYGLPLWHLGDAHAVDLPFATGSCIACGAGNDHVRLPGMIRCPMDKNLEEYSGILPTTEVLVTFETEMLFAAGCRPPSRLAAAAALDRFVPDVDHTIANLVMEGITAFGTGDRVAAALREGKHGPWNLLVGSSISIKAVNVDLRLLLQSEPQLAPEWVRNLIELKNQDLLMVSDGGAARWKSVLDAASAWFVGGDEARQLCLKGSLHRMFRLLRISVDYGVHRMSAFSCQGVERHAQELNNVFHLVQGDLVKAVSRVYGRRAIRHTGDVDADGTILTPRPPLVRSGK